MVWHRHCRIWGSQTKQLKFQDETTLLLTITISSSKYDRLKIRQRYVITAEFAVPKMKTKLLKFQDETTLLLTIAALSLNTREICDHCRICGFKDENHAAEEVIRRCVAQSFYEAPGRTFLARGCCRRDHCRRGVYWSRKPREFISGQRDHSTVIGRSTVPNLLSRVELWNAKPQ